MPASDLQAVISSGANRQALGAPTLRLLGDGAPTATRDYVLARNVTLLGRDPDCDIVLTPTDVSRRHARILRRSDGYYLEDLGSTAGTLLNDVSVSGAVCLKDGDLIRIGRCLLAY